MVNSASLLLLELQRCSIPHLYGLALVVHAVIHALGWTEFEDGLRKGVQLEVSNGLQGVCTELMVKIAAPLPQMGESRPEGSMQAEKAISVCHSAAARGLIPGHVSLQRLWDRSY